MRESLRKALDAEQGNKEGLPGGDDFEKILEEAMRKLQAKAMLKSAKTPEEKAALKAEQEKKKTLAINNLKKSKSYLLISVDETKTKLSLSVESAVCPRHVGTVMKGINEWVMGVAMKSLMKGSD